MDEFPVGGNAQLKSELAFRDRLSNRIHELARVKSRFEFKKEEDANWMIHHSQRSCPGTLAIVTTC
jgi:hypothetical protein